MVRCRRCGWSAPTRCSTPNGLAELYRASTFDYGDELEGLRATYGAALDRLAALVPQRHGLARYRVRKRLRARAGAATAAGTRSGASSPAPTRSPRPTQAVRRADRGRTSCAQVYSWLESFDAVTLFQVLDHMPDPVALLRECRSDPATGWRDPGVQSQRHGLVGTLAARAQPDHRCRAHLSLLAGHDATAVRPGRLRGHQRRACAQHLFALVSAPPASAARDVQDRPAVRGCANTPLGRVQADSSAGQPVSDRSPHDMKALVTGAGGFVGANLVRCLLAADDEPIAVVRPGSIPWRLRGSRRRVAIRAIDLRDADAVTSFGARDAPRGRLPPCGARGLLVADGLRHDAGRQRPRD